MKQRALCVAAALAWMVGCGDNTPAPSGAAHVPHHGGAITVDGCGYQLVTRERATAPEPGRPRLGATPEPYHIHLGLAADPRTSMVITWESRSADTLATTVQYGQASVAEAQKDGYTWDYLEGFDNDGPVVRWHEVHLCGLQPGTTYRYRVGGVGEDGAEAWSPEYSFRTAPDLAADPAAEVVLLSLGDTRGGYDMFGQLLAKATELASPDLILFSGDATTLGVLQGEWELYLDAAEPVLRTTPMVTAHGNHEINAVNYYSIFALPGDEENFSLDYGAAHLTVLNDTPEDTGDLTGKIPAFLTQDLTAAAAAPWRLVMHHRPPYSSSTVHGSALDLQEAWVPIYDAQGVDVVLNGHEHHYERTYPLRGGQVKASPAEGTIYVVSGGAGADLYSNGSESFTAASQSTQNMVVLRVKVGRLEATVYSDAGAVIDQFTITK